MDVFYNLVSKCLLCNAGLGMFLLLGANLFNLLAGKEGKDLKVFNNLGVVAVIEVLVNQVNILIVIVR